MRSKVTCISRQWQSRMGALSRDPIISVFNECHCGLVGGSWVGEAFVQCQEQPKTSPGPSLSPLMTLPEILRVPVLLATCFNESLWVKFSNIISRAVLCLAAPLGPSSLLRVLFHTIPLLPLLSSLLPVLSYLVGILLLLPKFLFSALCPSSSPPAVEFDKVAAFQGWLLRFKSCPLLLASSEISAN